MPDVTPGLYELIITRRLDADLSLLDTYLVQRAALDPGDADRVLAAHVTGLVQRALAGVMGEEKERLAHKVALANKLIAAIENLDAQAAEQGDHVHGAAALLHGIARPATGPAAVQFPARPELPMAAGALLVNGRGQPRVGHEVINEMRSSNEVDLLCAFLKWQGLRLIEDEVRSLIARGGVLRVITTTYMGATDQKAVDRLVELGASVKVSYDTHSTRLHAKAWSFRRSTGLNTGYVGSSNLSRTAMLDGLEWNVRISSIEQPSVLEAVQATFAEYWEDPSFESYDPTLDSDRLRAALEKEGGGSASLPLAITALDVEARPYQREILEQLDTERQVHGHWRNLVIMATGTGKTVVSALDYRRLREQGLVRRLLFVAHRQEILKQSQSVFRQVLKDGSFGELHVAGNISTSWEYVFASVQSLARMKLDAIPADHFDMVIVDEFHHASAKSYQQVLQHFTPKVLVGLTATPERTDGFDVRTYFDGEMTELRLWDALEQQLLAPFQYFGSHDDVDLTSVRWTRGSYDQAQLENVYTGNDARVRLVLRQVEQKISDALAMRALGFCVSVAHAEFMAQRFTDAGIPSLALSGGSPAEVRDSALAKLNAREINVIFTVDLFNEGIDLPTIDTILFLRPTESATVFLQQLGRGLRRSDDKACLTVLDFIGGQAAEFRFDLRFRALTGATRKELAAQIQSDFPFLPAGCHIQLDRVAKKVVLDNIKSALRLPSQRLVAELRQLGDVSLAEFLDKTQVELEDIYRSPDGSWTRLRREAGFDATLACDEDRNLGRRFSRILHVDDPRRLAALRRLIGTATSSQQPESTIERRTRAVLATDLFGQGAIPWSDVEIRARLAAYPSRRNELASLVEILESRQPRLTSVGSDRRVPLQVHARYSRDEALVAFGMEKPNSVMEGVRWIPEEQADVFFVTLNKIEGHYSPTTMYADRAISPTRFQWESQNRTSVHSSTGQRYFNHRSMGTSVHLFIRQSKSPDGQLGTPPYLYAGTMQYESHSGDRPIRIMWRLDEPLPIDVFQSARLAS